MDIDKVFMKGLTIIIVFITLGMTISSVASSVSNYYITIEAMKNGYIQQRASSYSPKLIWVKENEKQEN